MEIEALHSLSTGAFLGWLIGIGLRKYQLLSVGAITAEFLVAFSNGNYDRSLFLSSMAFATSITFIRQSLKSPS